MYCGKSGWLVVLSQNISLPKVTRGRLRAETGPIPARWNFFYRAVKGAIQYCLPASGNAPSTPSTSSTPNWCPTLPACPPEAPPATYLPTCKVSRLQRKDATLVITPPAHHRERLLCFPLIGQPGLIFTHCRPSPDRSVSKRHRRQSDLDPTFSKATASSHLLRFSLGLKGSRILSARLSNLVFSSHRYSTRSACLQPTFSFSRDTQANPSIIDFFF